ncbi:MAG TPA: VOC family protein [Solirubrobacterales bacterium]|jgi:predicted enzyme related to lactoylglutathione lyase
MAGEPSHFEIGAPDVERARRFFGELLGWDFDGTEKGAHISTPGAPGGIHVEDGVWVQLFFSVPDLDQAAKRVVELGGEVDEASSEGPGGRYLHSCRDDQGVPFGLHQPS